MKVFSNSPLLAALICLSSTILVRGQGQDVIEQMINTDPAHTSIFKDTMHFELTPGSSGDTTSSTIMFKAIAMVDTDFYPAYTPLKGFFSDMFELSPNAIYTGILAFRSPTSFEKVHLLAGEEMEIEIDLSEYYRLEPGQDYTVQFSYGVFLKSTNTILVKETSNLRKRILHPEESGEKNRLNKKEREQCRIENDIQIIDGVYYRNCNEADVAHIQLGFDQLAGREDIPAEFP